MVAVTDDRSRTAPPSRPEPRAGHSSGRPLGDAGFAARELVVTVVGCALLGVLSGAVGGLPERMAGGR